MAVLMSHKRDNSKWQARGQWIIKFILVLVILIFVGTENGLSHHFFLSKYWLYIIYAINLVLAIILLLRIKISLKRKSRKPHRNNSSLFAMCFTLLGVGILLLIFNMIILYTPAVLMNNNLIPSNQNMEEGTILEIYCSKENRKLSTQLIMNITVLLNDEIKKMGFPTKECNDYYYNNDRILLQKMLFGKKILLTKKDSFFGTLYIDWLPFSGVTFPQPSSLQLK